MLPDGNIEFLGRDDFQVKIQGHRIELGEIESALAQHPAVAAAVVTAWGDPRGAKQLAGYVVLKKPGEGVEEALRREGESAWADLPGERSAPSLLERRRFHRLPVPLETLGAVLAALLRVDIEGSPFPKLRYGSAGNLYPVQAYVHAASGRVDGLPAGAYYYDPSGHGLVLLAEGERLGASLLAAADRPAFEEAGFALFLVARMAAITPLYGAVSRRFAALEAGLMAELLAGVAAEHGLALSPAAGRLGELREALDLEESHEPLQILLGGFADPDREVPPAEPLAAEAAAAPPASGPTISDPIERLRFKTAHHGLRPDQGRPRIELPRPPLSLGRIEALYVTRRSYRRFPGWEAAPLAGLGALLAALPRQARPEPPALDLLLYAKPGRIEGLPGGTYAYEPAAHRLALLAEGATLTSSLYDPVNREVFEQAGFALLLVARAADRARPARSGAGGRPVGADPGDRRAGPRRRPRPDGWPTARPGARPLPSGAGRRAGPHPPRRAHRRGPGPHARLPCRGGGVPRPGERHRQGSAGRRAGDGRPQRHPRASSAASCRSTWCPPTCCGSTRCRCRPTARWTARRCPSPRPCARPRRPPAATTWRRRGTSSG